MLKQTSKKGLGFWHKTIIGLSLLFFLQVVGPFLKEGLFLGHDSQLHLIYFKKFEEAFRAGQFPVRWIDWIVPGFNHPLFNFYQPGVYYLYLFVRQVGLSNVDSIKVMLVFLWLLSSLLMYLFAKRHFGNLAAVLAAYFYLIAPYHVLDIFIRAALPEFTALTFVPGIFWAAKAYIDEKKGFYLSLLSLFTALTIISHPPTFIIFSPLILGYLLYNFWLTKSLSSLILSFLAIFIGFGLISFFLLPAFFEQQFIQTIYMRSGYYDFHHHFVCLSQLFSTFWGHGTSGSGCNDGMSFQLGLIHWLAVVLFLIILYFKFFLKKINTKLLKLVNPENLNKQQYALLTLCLVVLTLSLLMTTAATQPIWETLPYLPFIQYPWRFLSIIIFVASLIAGGVILIFKDDDFKYGAFVVMFIFATLAYTSYLKPIAYGAKEEINFGEEILHESVNGIKNFDPEPGYMPKWTDVLPSEQSRPKDEVEFATDSAKLTEVSLLPHFKKYSILTTSPTLTRFYTHYYPGWKIEVDQKEVTPNYDNIYGYMDLTIPQGQHQVTLKLENTRIRALANILSISFAIVSLLVIFLL